MRVVVTKTAQTDKVDQSRQRRGPARPPLISSGRRTLPSTVRHGRSDASWNTKPMSLLACASRGGLPSISDSAAGGALQAADDAQQRRLAAAAGPDQRHELAARHLKVDAGHGFEVLVVAFVDHGDASHRNVRGRCLPDAVVAHHPAVAYRLAVPLYGSARSKACGEAHWTDRRYGTRGQRARGPLGASRLAVFIGSRSADRGKEAAEEIARLSACAAQGRHERRRLLGRRCHLA